MNVATGAESITSNEHDTNQKKVSRLERFILIANLIAEIPSAVFDQLSSVHKPQYALLSMLMSFIVLTISIIDLVYKGRKERARLMWKGLIPIPWFYYPNHKPFGTFPDVIGLVCGIFQCVFSSIAYAFLSRHVDNPINVNAWPMIFATCVLYFRFSANPPPNTPPTRNNLESQNSAVNSTIMIKEAVTYTAVFVKDAATYVAVIIMLAFTCVFVCADLLVRGVGKVLGFLWPFILVHLLLFYFCYFICSFTNNSEIDTLACVRKLLSRRKGYSNVASNRDYDL